MSKPDLLMPAPMPPFIQDRLEPHFTIHRLWQSADPAAELKRIGPRIRAIAKGMAAVIDGPLMAQLPNLAIVANFGVGYDAVDARWAGAHGIVVTNTPDVLTEEVADTTLGLIFSTLRQTTQAENYLRSSQWLKAPFPLTPLTMRDRKAGILGLGRIGKAVARRLEAFGVPVSYYGRNRQADVSYPYHATLKGMAEAVNLLICIAPGGAETKHMINAEIFKALGPDGVFINIGRGSAVDEAALVEALKTKTIASCGLDVYEDEPRVRPELLAFDHITLWPHIGSASQHTRNLMGQLVVDNLLAWLHGKPVLTPVAETLFAPKPV